MDKKHELVTICGVRGFVDENGVAQLNAEDVARGWGFVEKKKGRVVATSGDTYEAVRWKRVNDYLKEFGFPPLVGGNSQPVGKDDFIPENMVYRLGFKASNETAQVFQAKLADEILPTIRKTGSYSAKPMSQVDILVESAKVLQEHERRMANLEMDIEEVKEGTKQTNERINTLNGVCTEGTKRQKLVALVNTYARKIGITYEKAWQEFKNAFNTAFHTNLGSRMKHFKEKHDIKKLTLPDYLEREGLLDDGLRIIDKMMGLQLMKI